MMGMGTGSLMGGAFIGGGRRRVLILFNFIIIIATVPMCITNFWSILVGKLIYGFSAGVMLVAAPKMLDETIPIYKLKFFGLATNVNLNFGITIAMIMGLWLPKNDHIEEMKTTQVWRYIFAMPAVWGVLQLICLFTILKYDSLIVLI